jgi:hypothetical protein
LLEVTFGDLQQTVDIVRQRLRVAARAGAVGQAQGLILLPSEAVEALAGLGVLGHQSGLPKHSQVVVEAVGVAAELLGQCGDTRGTAQGGQGVDQLLPDGRGQHLDVRGVGNGARVEAGLCHGLPPY